MVFFSFFGAFFGAGFFGAGLGPFGPLVFGPLGFGPLPFNAATLAGLILEAKLTGLLDPILEANGFLVGSTINSNFNLLEPPSIGAPLYFSTALAAALLFLKIMVAIPLNCPFSLYDNAMF